MNILGLGGAVGHDPATALFINGELIAAAEEERFIRDKHAKGLTGHEATKFCLRQAGLSPQDIDIVAYPYAPIPLSRPDRWHYARRFAYAPDRALTALLNGNRRFKRNKRQALSMLDDLGFDMSKTKFQPVEHHMAHASSAYHLSGFSGKTAILGIDGKGEYATTFFGYAENGRIHKIKEFYDPDSLGGVYGSLTEFLGFEMLDGEFKVMGMAPYGDPDKYDFSRLIEYGNGDFRVNNKLVNVIGNRRYKEDDKGYYFSPALIDWLGPKRQGDEIDDPYIDYAASMQKLLEDVALHLVDYYLKDILQVTGKLAFAGGVALNVKLNQRLMALPYVDELFVQPAASDSGTAIGAASYAAHLAGETILPQKHTYLGPAYTNEECIEACMNHSEKPDWEILEDPSITGAQILAAGNPLSWFQGRMEFGPRSLGNRSILGDPSYPGVADRINEQIKYRERWRPFCPSMLDTVAEDLLQSKHPAPYMTFTFDMAEHWKERVPEVVHEDGTVRAQIVTEETNPRYYSLLKELERLRGHGVCLNTSLNRRGEPMVCSPMDALNMLYGSDLQFLIMENVMVKKASAPAFRNS
ncbi:MAG: carbamoyltransferase [Opitutales bacterium]